MLQGIKKWICKGSEHPKYRVSAIGFPSASHFTTRVPRGFVFESKVPFWVRTIARHPYKKDPKRDINLENYP